MADGDAPLKGLLKAVDAGLFVNPLAEPVGGGTPRLWTRGAWVVPGWVMSQGGVPPAPEYRDFEVIERIPVRNPSTSHTIRATAKYERLVPANAWLSIFQKNGLDARFENHAFPLTGSRVLIDKDIPPNSTGTATWWACEASAWVDAWNAAVKNAGKSLGPLKVVFQIEQYAYTLA